MILNHLESRVGVCGLFFQRMTFGPIHTILFTGLPGGLIEIQISYLLPYVCELKFGKPHIFFILCILFYENRPLLSFSGAYA